MLDTMGPPSHLRQLLVQLNSQRTNGFLCDIIIVVQNALFRAHKNILAASSVYLKSLVVHNNLIHLEHELVSPSIFRIILDFIYTGRLGEAELFGAILSAASYLQIPDLVSLCKKKLKRNSKYLHVTTGYSPYGGIGRGHKGNTPVIQSCFSSSSRPIDLQPVEPVNSINNHCAQLYTQEKQKLQHGLCPPEMCCSPLCGLDLSKKSPLRPSAQHPPHRLTSGGDNREPAVPVRPESSPVSARLLPHYLRLNVSEAPDPHSYRNNDHPRRTETPEELMIRWMKHEPLASYESDREKDLEREDKGGSPPLTQKHGYPSIESNEPDNDKEIGSNEDPRRSSNLERYHRGHIGYDPESFEDNLYVCIPCGKGFPSSEQLNTHVEAHNKEELYHKQSMELPVQFLDKSNQGLDDIIRPFRCSSCDKSYKDPATLRQHEKTHWLSKPYSCNICGKKFTQRGTMTRHMRSHLGLKPYACDTCGMRFTRQYRLTEHMRIHSGEKPYECQVCGGKFTQQRNLISHMKLHTTGPDGKPKLDFSESVYAMAKFTADHLGLKQKKAAEIFSQTSHFLNDPKTIETFYPLAKFTAEHLGLTQEKAAEIIGPIQHLGSDSRIIERFSSP